MHIEYEEVKFNRKTKISDYIIIYKEKTTNRGQNEGYHYLLRISKRNIIIIFYYIIPVQSVYKNVIFLLLK